MIASCHGGDIYSRKIEYDFSANINPLGMPECVKSALINNIGAFERYPDVNCTSLKNAISQRENIGTDNIVCGNGAADLIYRIVQTAMPKKALLIAPTFSEYEKALRSFGCDIEYFFLNESSGFTLTDDILDKLCGKDIFFLCNPNNPVGNLVDSELMSRIVRRCCENKILLVIDECFMSFVSDSRKYSVRADFGKVIILKAFTKIYAMPGLRLGYMLCGDGELCEKVENCGQCWSVSAAAQIAGEAALTDKGYIEKTLEYVKKEREFLTGNLNRLGLKTFSSAANFIFIKSDLPIDRLLLKEKIAVRSCVDYVNLSEKFFRIAVRTHAENEVLISTLERILKNG